MRNRKFLLYEHDPLKISLLENNKTNCVKLTMWFSSISLALNKGSNLNHLHFSQYSLIIAYWFHLCTCKIIKQKQVLKI